MLTQDEVHKLLDRLCVGLGFCLPPEDMQHLTKDPPVGVRLFTKAVFLAEGMDLDTADWHLYRQVQDVVAKAFREAEDCST